MCERAVNAIAKLPGITMQVRSRWYSSAPVPPGPQPRFINGVVRIAGDISPDQLLTALQELERRAGRVRGVPNAARPLDLDIIDMDGVIRDTQDLMLPHPRAHERAFVLLPLRDVAPRWIHPRLGVPIAALIAALEPQDIRVA
jgi:2-amino-4-hydroxy-6-hydroxymethyldihydropteridine diphosphokinase